MGYCYKLEIRSDVDHSWRVCLGVFLEEWFVVASAYNVAPHDASIVYRPYDGEQRLLRAGQKEQDDIYLILQVPLHSEPLTPPPQPHQEEKRQDYAPPHKEDIHDEDFDDEGDYSQWYDRQPGDHEMPDNYPEAVDPEDFAPDYDDHDDLVIGWLESAIDEVNYEQDHPDEP